MRRRTLLTAASLLVPSGSSQPLFGSKVLAVSVFAGQGNRKNIDTGLRYNGMKVSPTFVSITPQGFNVIAETGVNPHTADTNIDVNVSGGVPWIGCAFYIQ